MWNQQRWSTGLLGTQGQYSGVPPRSSQMSNTAHFARYIAAYARKDLEAIDSMLAPEVHLRDWNLNVHGKEAALAETVKNFAAARTIAIEILELYQAGSTVAGELRIVMNQSCELHVVDVITFSSEGKILCIRAYLGRPGE